MRKGGAARIERTAVKRGHGSARCALALALQCGGRGLLFRPIERSHSEKEVMGGGNAWPIE